MPPKRRLLVTAALPYANGPLHLGHMVGYIQADIWVRFQKMQGHDCIFISGSDGHGTPIMIQAEKMGTTPELLIESIGLDQKRDFDDFFISFDNYYTSHSPENQRLVEVIYERHVRAGNIAKRTIQQLYDPVKTLFLPDRYIKGTCPNCKSSDQYGDNCEVCGATYQPTDLIEPYSILSGERPIVKSSEHIFFKLQHYTDFLKKWTNQGHLQTEVRHKLSEWLDSGLKEWDISRDAPYFGFPIPNEKDKYFYVWLDAPVGYMASFANLCERRRDLKFHEYWETESTVELYHFIGKDIIYFHALFWPAILYGANFRTPTAIFANGFLTINGQKMSKSRGTFIKARTYLRHLDPQYLRYYFAAKLNNRIDDLDINFDDFVNRVNADLVGKLVNIASRCAPFIHQYFDGRLANHCQDLYLYQQFAEAGNKISTLWDQLDCSQAIREIMALADRANQYIDEKKPWILVKGDQKADVQAICTMGLNLFRLLIIYLKPVLPKMAREVEYFLNSEPFNWNDKDTPLLNNTIRLFKPLLYRIDPKQIEAMQMEIHEEAVPHKEAKIDEETTISIDTFNKIDLRIAKILEANEIEGADKLLQLKVDLGEGTKHIFAGIKSSYKPEELIGRHVVVVANLAPRKMRFGTSEGMLLVAKGEQAELFLISPDPGASAGMKVS